jgi:N-acetyl-gamma-glutamyl-phosphate reductase
MHYTMHKIPVGVLGASGYAGRELCGLISRHPRLSLVFASANEQRGKTADLPFGGTVEFVATEDASLSQARLVFSALPHGASQRWVLEARNAGAKVVDLSADLRIGNDEQGNHAVPYGLTELKRSAVQVADVVANPGCYPTAILLALLPLLEQRIVAPGTTIGVNAASGVTGAGFTARTDLLFGEVSENFRAYSVGNVHRHLNEMRAMLSELDVDVDLLFTPHLLPVARGILATITVSLAHPLSDPLAPWKSRYAHEPFIELVDRPPELRHVVHRNVVRIAAIAVEQVRTPTLLVFAAIDNLMKGAAGQAVQNANLMLGLEETLGLPA